MELFGLDPQDMPEGVSTALPALTQSLEKAKADQSPPNPPDKSEAWKKASDEEIQARKEIDSLEKQDKHLSQVIQGAEAKLEQAKLEPEWLEPEWLHIYIYICIYVSGKFCLVHQAPPLRRGT